MATLASPTRIGSVNGSSGYSQQLNIYTFNSSTVAGYYNYIHLKTNINNYANKIIVIEAIGYNYEASSAIRCAWGFYTWNGTLYPRGLFNKVPAGLEAENLYLSTDSYVVLRARALSGSWYCGFTLNAYVNTAYYTENIQITAANRNTNSGNYY